MSPHKRFLGVLALGMTLLAPNVTLGFDTPATIEQAVAPNPPPPAEQQGPPAPGVHSELERRILDLEATVRRLQEQRTPAQPSARPDGAKEASGRPAPGKADGPAVKDAAATTGDGKTKFEWKDLSKEGWTVKLGGHVQLDYVTWPQADPEIVGAIDYFSFRRLRLVADGVGYGVFDFRLQMTLEPGSGPVNNFASPDVKDAYLSMNEIPFIGRIRIGNFFVPFSLEQVTNDTNNIFLERSIPSQGIFAVDREVGIGFYNCTDDQRVTWSGGFFFDNLNDTFKTRIDSNQGYRIAGRLTGLPFYDDCSEGRYLVHVGTGLLYSHDQDRSVTFQARPQVQQAPVLISSGALPAGDYVTGNLELAVTWGPITLQSEAFGSHVNLLNDDSVYLGGAYAHVSYFLTGENRIFEKFGQHGAQFGRNRPFTNLFITRDGAGWGAWELKARLSYLDLNSVDRGRYHDFTVGFNWYWSDRTRIMFDWIHPITSAETLFGSTQSDLIGMRFDFNW